MPVILFNFKTIHHPFRLLMGPIVSLKDT
jgi:hypothetical protein